MEPPLLILLQLYPPCSLPWPKAMWSLGWEEWQTHNTHYPLLLWGKTPVNRPSCADRLWEDPVERLKMVAVPVPSPSPLSLAPSHLIQESGSEAKYIMLITSQNHSGEISIAQECLFQRLLMKTLSLLSAVKSSLWNLLITCNMKMLKECILNSTYI